MQTNMQIQIAKAHPLMDIRSEFDQDLHFALLIPEA